MGIARHRYKVADFPAAVQQRVTLRENGEGEF
jgi:hypothetical protein